MPVIPSFSGFASTPNLGSDYLGGVNAAQSANKVAQDAFADAQRIQLGREQIAGEQVRAQMHLDATQKTLDMQHLIEQHRAEVLAAYRTAQLGMEDGRLKVEQANSKVRIDAAARQMQAEQNYERVRQAKIDAGMSEREASEAAMREVGFGAAGFNRAFPGAGGPPKPDFETTTRIKDIEGRIAQENSAMLRMKPSDFIGEGDTTSQEQFQNAAATHQARLRDLGRQRDALFGRTKSPSANAPRELTPPPTMTATTPAPAPSPVANPGLTIPPSVASREAVGGYKIGSVYKGLKYLGGDPKNESSWERVR